MKSSLAFSPFMILCVFILLISCDSPEKKKEIVRITDSLNRINNTFIYIRDSIEREKLKKVCWEVRYYVDDFGDSSNEKYLSNTSPIQGTFSNSATENSRLNVKILIDSPNSISIQLYEYGGTNPVKSGIDKGYRIKVKSENSDVLVLNAKNYSDRLKLGKTDSKKLSDFLKRTGLIQFSIIELSDYGQSTYRFDLDNFESIESKLTELKLKTKIILQGY